MDITANTFAPRRSAFVFGALGILLIVAGLACTPSFVAHFTSDGSITTPWRIVQIHLVQVYALAVGAALLSSYIITRSFSKENTHLPVFLSGVVMGLSLICLSVVLSPSLIERQFSPTGVLEDEQLTTLASLRLATLTLGCLLLAAQFSAYRRVFPMRTNVLTVLLFGTIPLYLGLVYATYVRERYPDNILLSVSTPRKMMMLLLGQDILLTEYQPQPMLEVERRQITKAKYPVIDVHFHFESTFITERDKTVLAPESLLRSMDALGVRTIVNLDGTVKNFDKLFNEYHCQHPDRFLNFSSATKLKENVEKGARGLKVWKMVGLTIRDETGKVIPVNDSRNDPMWVKAGELRVPVLWHIGDPPAFFRPVNRFNERYEELRRYPEWSFYGPRFPSWENLLKQREQVIKNHPETIFIAAHMGDNGDNLKDVARLLDAYPNYYVEISSRLPELGRQPYTARKFFIEYQDRILFGSDGGAMFNEQWTLERFYRTYFEFLETENEYFDYPLWGQINQGRWKIYGLHLPDEVLEKVYYKNAERILSMRAPLSATPGSGCE
jgi:predicted TIM-barrel fold metal-dependent hydrolase